jgi:predicted N-acyltransferase
MSAPVMLREEVMPLGGAEQVPAEGWNRLATRGFHLHEWCTVAERCGWTPRHVGVRGTGGLRAVVTAYLTGRGTLHDLHDRWLGRLSRFASRTAMDIRPVLSVQSPLGLASEPLGDFAALSEQALHAVFDLLEQSAERDGAKAVAWPFVDATCHRLLDVGRERGYAVHYAGSTARLPVPWGSFDEYLASRSKNVRRTIRADLEALRSAGIRTSFLDCFHEEAAAMDREFRKAFHRRNGRDASLAANLFTELGRHPSSGIRAHLTWAGERLVGTSLNLISPGLMDGTLAAFAPEYRAGPVYYNDLCYEPIRLAIRERVSAIELGSTALYAKVLRGAVLRRRMVLIRGTTPARHGLLSLLGHLVAQRTEYKERRALGRLWSARCFSQEDEAR